MDNNELAGTVGQAVGQTLGEMSVGMGIAVLALANAVSRQPGIDRDQLFTDMLEALPQLDGAANNVIEVLRQALQATLDAGDQTG